MAPIPFAPASHSKIARQIPNNNAPNAIPNPVDASQQFHVNQIETIVFGLLATLFAFTGLIFAALQLRQMYRAQHSEVDEQNLAELAARMSTSNLPINYVSILTSFLANVSPSTSTIDDIIDTAEHNPTPTKSTTGLLDASTITSATVDHNQYDEDPSFIESSLVD